MTVLLNRANLQKLSTRRQIACLKFLYKLYNKKFNIDPTLYLYPPARVSPRTSHPYAISPYATRIDLFKFSFLPRTIIDWNKLDSSVFVDCESSEIFQHRLELILT